MVEGQELCMKHDARGAHQVPGKSLRVDAFSEERMPGFGEVNTDLVSPPCLEATRNQARILEALHHLDVGDGFPAQGGVLGRPPETIPPVTYQLGANASARRMAVNESEIAAFGRVEAKLILEALLGVVGAGEDEHPSRFLVQAMHDIDAPTSSATTDRPRDLLVEGVLLGAIVGLRRDPGRFVHHDDLAVEMKNPLVLGACARRQRTR